jgi:hypothetical protein
MDRVRVEPTTSAYGSSPHRLLMESLFKFHPVHT